MRVIMLLSASMEAGGGDTYCPCPVAAKYAHMLTDVCCMLCSFSSPAVARAKAAIEAVDYLDLDSGIDFERY